MEAKGQNVLVNIMMVHCIHVYNHIHNHCVMQMSMNNFKNINNDKALTHVQKQHQNC